MVTIKSNILINTTESGISPGTAEAIPGYTPCSVVTGKLGSTSTTIHNRAYTKLERTVP
nr:MAG TPA: hypothetical protein [Caudoviricetes sp.]